MGYALKRGKGKAIARKIRHQRVRKHVFGTPERPRLAVFRSNRHVVAQVIDDVAGHTLAAASTMELAGQEVEGAKIGAAHQVGLLVAEAKGIEKVVFDRGGNKYHGRVAAVAEGAREAGLSL